MQGVLNLSQFTENHKTIPWEPLESTLNLLCKLPEVKSYVRLYNSKTCRTSLLPE